MTAVLSVENLGKTFVQSGRSVVALHDISLSVEPGECLAVLGESGSGKSTLANLVLGLFQLTTGAMAFQGDPLPAKRELHHRRAIQLVQQNPASALNPRRSIGASLRLALDVQSIGTKAERPARVGRLPVAIARALACEAQLIVLEEPAPALDELVQAQVLRLLADLWQNHGLTYLFITHDLAVVRNIASRVAVFEKGQMVELADTETIFHNPTHPYTRRLISAVPVKTDEEKTMRDTLARGLA